MQGATTGRKRAYTEGSVLHQFLNIMIAAAAVALIVVIISVISGYCGVAAEYSSVEKNITELYHRQQILNNQLFNNRDEANILNMAVLDYHMHKATEDEIIHVDMTEFYDVKVETVEAAETAEAAETEETVTAAEELPEESVTAVEDAQTVQAVEEPEITIEIQSGIQSGTESENQSAQIGE